ncbi:MAG: histidine--tRNA ligase [Candidatus Sericytochromatia bacterium]
MNKIIQPKTLKGFRDFLPDLMLNKKKMIGIIERTFESFGFAPIDTPCVEYTEILLGKGGDETDKQLFRFNDNGGRDVTLRFDLTVPLARFTSQYYNELGMPFKAYHIAPVWRGENTSKGRYREFYQCDFDILGTETNFSDIEIGIIIHNVVKSLIGSEEFTIRFNNRMILNGLMKELNLEDKTVEVLRVIDKIYKQSEDKIIQELTEKVGLTEEQTTNVLSFIKIKGTNKEIVATLKERFKNNEQALKGVINIEEFVLTFESLGYNTLKIDLCIARGLDYYTGSVFETMLNKLPELGSICSGGRYDNLASLYSTNKIAGVGASVGLDRLLDGLEELKLLEKKATPATVLILMLDDNYKEKYLQIAMNLRSKGIKVELFNEKKKLDKQMKYADRKGFKFVITNGSNEFEKNIIRIKNMETGEIIEKNLEELENVFR